MMRLNSPDFLGEKDLRYFVKMDIHLEWGLSDHICQLYYPLNHPTNPIYLMGVCNAIEAITIHVLMFVKPRLLHETLLYLS